MNVLILTGAGVSAESGIPVFRGPNGLWEGYRLEDVANPQAFQRNPELVHRFYNLRRQKLLSPEVQPNAAHRSIAEFEIQHRSGSFLLITQNIDDLHQRAGSRNVAPMHGELLKARCMDSGETFPWRDDLGLHTPHPRDPQRLGRLRPHVVWFGEMPLELERIERAASQADIFISIGTSSVVYPAAAIVEWTPTKCRRIEVNLEQTPQSPRFGESYRGPATGVVPELLASLKSQVA